MSITRYATPKSFHVKKDDVVKVISGAHKGREGKILQVLRTDNRVIIEGVRMIKKAARPTQENPKGGFTEKEGSIHISNVKLVTAAEKTPSKAKK
ncbi:MAG: 50S ribosomal protein L24 [Candidatus Methylacidiphilales bacterium]|nr:50S ribosomal protein L24 [Candidatus Methylacidiphilales bacterium]